MNRRLATYRKVIKKSVVHVFLHKINKFYVYTQLTHEVWQGMNLIYVSDITSYSGLCICMHYLYL